MTMATTSSLPAAQSHGRPRGWLALRTHWLAIGVIFLIGALWQVSHPPSADVSWLIVIDEKILAGQQLYKDIVEVNPPMSALLYMPAVLIEHLTGITAETAVIGLTVALMLAAFALTARIMRMNGRGDDVPRLLIVAACLLAVVPMVVFAEREHIAATLMLPALALMVARAEGGAPDRTARILVGLGSGLIVAIKPHFGLAILLPTLYLAIRLRSWRVIFALENLIAGAIVLAYAVLVVVVFRAYLTDMVPMLADTYRIVRDTPWHLAVSNLGFMIVAGTLVVALLILGRDARQPKIILPMLAATGFLLAFLEQGKGWIYHLYPAMMLAFLLLGTDALKKAIAGLRVDLKSLAAILFLALSFKGLFMIVSVMKGRDAFETDLAPYVASHFDHPRLLSLGRSLGIGQPLTRMVGGTWVGTNATAFIPEAAAHVALMPDASDELKARVAHWMDWDRACLARDLREGRPDVILLDRATYPYDELMASGTEAARLLAAYHRIETIEGIDILVPDAHAASGVAAHPRAG